MKLIDKLYESLQHIVKFSYVWLDNVVYIHDSVLENLRTVARENGVDYSNEFFAIEDTKTLVNTICSNIYSSGNAKYIQLAMLQQIFHHAIHNRYYEARDLLYNTKLGDVSIMLLDQEGQQLFNRAIVAISLCAFRLGKL